jgi:hypothetical protein
VAHRIFPKHADGPAPKRQIYVALSSFTAFGISCRVVQGAQTHTGEQTQGNGDAGAKIKRRAEVKGLEAMKPTNAICIRV